MLMHSRNSLWNPWHELSDLDTAFGALLNNFTGRTEFPPANVWTSDNAITFTFAMPGLKADDIEVAAKADTLTIKGTRVPENLPEGAQVLRQERTAGTFARSFALPFKIEQEAVEASYINGILTVTLPKAKEVQPRKITIAANR